MTLLRCCGSHLLLDLRCHSNESIFDIASTLSRSLDEGDAKGVGKLLSGSSINLPFVLKVTLVTDEQTINVLTSETINLAKPLLHAGEGLGVSDIIHNDDTMSTTVVTASDSTETLLASSIPLLLHKQTNKQKNTNQRVKKNHQRKNNNNWNDDIKGNKQSEA